MKKRIVILNGKEKKLAIGYGMPVRVSAPIGINSYDDIKEKIRLLEKLLSNNFSLPDIVADLSLFAPKKRFYEYIIERFSGPVGILPHYIAHTEKELLKEIEHALKIGVSHLTLHITAKEKLFKLAQESRFNNSTSRGGSIILNELLKSNRKENLFEKNLKTIISILKNSGVVVSLGSTFRPSGIDEAMDTVHIEETKSQILYANIFNSEGIDTMIEGLGHASKYNIIEYYKLLRNLGNTSPLMTLGPLACDSLLEYDPIASSIGATILSDYEYFSIIQTITSEEHLGGVPSEKSSINGFQIAKSVANCLNSNIGYNKKDLNISFHRKIFQTCKIETLPDESQHENFNCLRCLNYCPLRSNNNFSKNPLIEHINNHLPSPFNLLVDKLVRELENLNVGTIILFGSTAKGLFSYSLYENNIFLGSDLEFNIISEHQVNIKTIDSVYEIVKKYLKEIGLEQPLFDIDIRIRNSNSLPQIPNDLQIKKSLFCYGIRDSNKFWDNSSSETDILNNKDSFSAFFRSALEWLSLRIIHLSNLTLDINYKTYWINAIKASFICKLVPNYLIKYGLPYTGSHLDIRNLQNICKSQNKNNALIKYVSILEKCWAARQDKEGMKIISLDIDLVVIDDIVNEIYSYYKSNKLIESGIIEDFTIVLLEFITVNKSWGNTNLLYIKRTKKAFENFLNNYRNNDINFSIKYNYHLNIDL